MEDTYFAYPQKITQLSNFFMLEAGFYWYQSNNQVHPTVVKIDEAGDVHIPGVTIPFTLSFALTRGVIYIKPLVFPEKPRVREVFCPEPFQHYFFYPKNGCPTVFGISEFGDALLPSQEDFPIRKLLENGVVHPIPARKPDAIESTNYSDIHQKLNKNRIK